jgi:DNA-binding NtrC family response regulator
MIQSGPARLVLTKTGFPMHARVVLLVENSFTGPSHWEDVFHGYRVEVVHASANTDVWDAGDRLRPDIVVIEGCDDALRDSERIRFFSASLPVVALLATSSEERAIAALRIGVNDYLKQSCTQEEVVQAVLRWARREKSPTDSGPSRGRPMVGTSNLTRDVRARIAKAAGNDGNVLITGETGTGKELVAQLIHQNSRRYKEPMICVNCAALPESLIESELFGHEKGAFTGANVASQGKLQCAGAGTIFFDEIGDMSLPAQAKILRAIESKEYQRLGGSRSVTLNARIIAGTNQGLERFVEEERFRKDLYYRLNVVRIHLAPLRERPEDVPALIDHFVQLLNASFGQSVQGVSDEIRDRFMSYAWPGNVRELRNVMEGIFLEAPPPVIQYRDIPQVIREHLEDSAAITLPERARMLAALQSTRWNVTRAAEKLRWSRMTFYRKMAKHHIASAKL